MNKKFRNILPEDSVFKSSWEEDTISVGEMPPRGPVRYVSSKALVFEGLMDPQEKILFSRGYVDLCARARENPAGPYRIALRCIKIKERYLVPERHLRIYGWNLEDPKDFDQMSNLANIYLEEKYGRGEITEEIALERDRIFAEHEEEFDIAGMMKEELKGLERKRKGNKENE